jgi:hypothetical protein
MAEESYAFFASVVADNLPASTLLKANYTYVNARLAQHYGLPGVASPTAQRVQTDGSRGGVLTQATTLAVTSTPNRTSIVKRGVWVLRNLMCQGLPPPPGVPVLPPPDPTLTQRQQIMVHQSQPPCAACHTVFDPIGFGMEGYNAVGLARTTDDNGAPLDTSGALPGGQTFDGIAGLSDVLHADARFPACFEQKLVTYSLGRKPAGDAEQAAVTGLLSTAQANGYKLQDMVVAVATSDLFRTMQLTKEAP